MHVQPQCSVCMLDLMLFTYVVLHPPFILGEQGNEEEVMASEQEACACHTATAVVFCCRHSLALRLFCHLCSSLHLLLTRHVIYLVVAAYMSCKELENWKMETFLSKTYIVVTLYSIFRI